MTKKNKRASSAAGTRQTDKEASKAKKADASANRQQAVQLPQTRRAPREDRSASGGGGGS
ncbi:hypothetical protein ACFWC5_41055 [Streptomyces sp. NPDC060085]|uniref:hypothetical protein n=1 Tax=Streptomyces sp. NPDC060085 TaxID=3347054 RepID=UPI00366A1CB1